MSPNDNNAEEMRALLAELREETISDAGSDRLAQLVREDRDARRMYIHYMAMVANIRARMSDRPTVAEIPPAEMPSDTNNPSLELTFPILSPLPSPLSTPFVGGPVFSYMVATVVLCAMLLGAWAYKVTHVANLPGDMANQFRKETPRIPAAVGKITGMKDCRWGQNEAGTIIGASVPLGRKYTLESGLLQITYKTGANVILEGPCEFIADSRDGGYLRIGKLVANVEKRGERRGERGEKAGGLVASATSAQPQAATPEPRIPNPESPAPGPQSLLSTLHSPLFTIKTPTAIVTDLGTEFGVEVDTDGNTTSCVFRGTIKVEAGDKESVELNADESVRVEKTDRVREKHREGTSDGKVRLTRPADMPKFVRRMAEPPQRLDLLDIMAGGDGSHTRRERGIDPSSGKQDPVFMITEYAGDGEYHSVAFTKLIDGVFVPAADGLGVRIDSSGHTYDFGRNAGKTIGSIWARSAEISSQNKKRNRYDWVYSIGGDEFMPVRRGLLCLHANAGISFDLAAIRELYSGMRPVLFRSTAGVGDTSAIHPDTDPYSVDFRVFVDGAVKYERKAHTRLDGVLDIEVGIGSDDQFLTLVVTDCDGRCAYDWSVFGDPALEMGASGDMEEHSRGN